MIAPVITVQNVSKGFRYWHERPSSIKTLLVDIMRARVKTGTVVHFPVLKNVSFDIHAGEFVGIMGRNGAGKSTILKLISGIYTPDSGKISVTRMIAPLIELGAGFNGELSGYENIFLNAAILGFGRNATRAALNEIIEFSELGDKIHMPVKNYSSGMMVRLGFSIATHLEAPILLVDEILAVGDEGFQKKCIEKIQTLHRLGRTIILITHNPDHVANHCQRCIILNDQQKVYDGDPVKGARVYHDLF